MAKIYRHGEIVTLPRENAFASSADAQRYLDDMLAAMTAVHHPDYKGALTDGWEVREDLDAPDDAPASMPAARVSRRRP
jgi:hypothetical protein